MNIAIAILFAILAVGVLLAFLFIWLVTLAARQPFRSFVDLSTSQKLWFLKRLATDSRIPWTAKIMPLLVVVYVAMPFDIIPDVVSVVGHLDDIAVGVLGLLLAFWLAPSDIVAELLWRASQEG